MKKRPGQQFIDSVEAALEDNGQRPKGMPPLDVITSEVLRIGFCREDASSIYDFWLSNGFKVGSRQVRDWRAAIRNMARFNRLPSQQAKPPGLIAHRKEKPAQLRETERDRRKSMGKQATDQELRQVGAALKKWRKDNKLS